MKFHSDFPYTMHRIWKDTRSKELRNILQREPSWIHSRLWLKTCLKVLLLQTQRMASYIVGLREIYKTMVTIFCDEKIASDIGFLFTIDK